MRRVVIDTNCLLAILPSRSKYHQVWTDFLEERLEICVSNEILMESPTWRFHLISKDPDDNKFVDCTIAGQAEFLISNDKHFLELKDIDFPAVNTVTLQEFIHQI